MDLGVGSPVGFVGLSLSRWLGTHAAIEGGVGYGYTGLQLSLLAKAALASGQNLCSLAGGPSTSLSVKNDSNQPRLTWAHAELGCQRLERDFLIAISAGVAFGIRGQFQAFCLFPLDSDCKPINIEGRVFPMIRVGVGRRF
ncbi:MAG TPA: hypothetical protein VGG33_22240 [Polyangia bacterium]